MMTKTSEDLLKTSMHVHQNSVDFMTSTVFLLREKEVNIFIGFI